MQNSEWRNRLKTMKFSRKGDRGETSLLTGERVSKASLQPETYGTLDEAASALGLAKAFTKNQKIRQMIEAVQEDLLILGSELACEVDGDPPRRIHADRTARLGTWIEELQKEVQLPGHFIHPGAHPAGAAVDLGRTIIRRAERRVVVLLESKVIQKEILIAYLNRLSSLIFILEIFEINQSGKSIELAKKD